MNESSHLRRLAIFFLLAFLDERLAAEISDRASATYKSKNRKNLDSDSAEMRLLTIQLCKSFWESNKKRVARNQTTPTIERFGKLPNEVSLQPWIKFHRQTPDDEIIVFILSQVLKFTEQEVSDSLKISVGTLRHRISRSIRTLGGFCV